MILLSCTKHPGYTGAEIPAGIVDCLACQFIYAARKTGEARKQLGVKVGEASEAWKVEDAIERTD